MKSLLLLPFLAVGSNAMAGELNLGVAGGGVVTDPLEVLGSTWTVVPRVGYFFNETVGAEIDFGILAGNTKFGAEDYGYLGLTPRLNLIGKLWTRGKRDAYGNEGKAPPIQPLLVAGIGGFYKKTNDAIDTDGDGTEDGFGLGDDYNRKDLDFLVNAGPGLMIPLGPIHFRTDMRWLVSLGNENFQNRGDQFMNWEWTAGVGVTFGGARDRDNDGIMDDDDSCPDEPEDIDQFEDEDGCPDLDNDNDGVMDSTDECPNDAEDMDDFEDLDGCPDTDNDEDGILDVDDLCPVTAGVAEFDGCPDTDGDGVQDTKDECVDEPGPVESFGCPDEDADRVPDYRDACPDEPAPKMINPLFSDGCPHKVVLTDTKIVILEKIFFELDKSVIQKKSFALLEEVADTLKDFPIVKKVSIEGHTDTQGADDYNLKLSDERAKSVRMHLIEVHGIEAERLEAKGYGETVLLPDVDPDTKEGQAKLRRVEFNITEMDQAKRVVQKRAVVEFEDSDLSFEGLDIETKLPTELPFSGDVTCKAMARIGEDGTTERVTVTDCVGLPRSVARRTLRQWTFKPIEIKGKATKATASFTVEFKEGKTLITLDDNGIKAVE